MFPPENDGGEFVCGTHSIKKYSFRKSAAVSVSRKCVPNTASAVNSFQSYQRK